MTGGMDMMAGQVHFDDDANDNDDVDDAGDDDDDDGAGDDDYGADGGDDDDDTSLCGKRDL